MATRRRRLISILICAVMCLTLLPQSAFAEESNTQPESTEQQTSVEAENNAETESNAESEAVIQQQSATQQATTVSSASADTLYASVKETYKAVEYEDFFDILSPYVSGTDKLNIQTQLIKELGTVPTDEQLTSRIRQVYMDKLGMNDAFDEVIEDLDTIMPKVLANSQLSTVTAQSLSDDKLKVLLALTYLNRYYSFEAGGVAAKDIIIYSPEIVGGQAGSYALSTLSSLGSALSYEDAKGSNTSTFYKEHIGRITEVYDITTFLQKMLTGTGTGISADEYLRQSNAVIEERGQESLFTKMQNDSRLKSYLLPLLSLSTKSIYVISADYTTTVGLTSTYGGAQDEEFLTRIEKAADSQQSFMDFWKRTSKTASSLDLGRDIIVIDTMAVKGEQGQSTSQLWSAEYGDTADVGVREFMTPMGLYRTYLGASAEADISGMRVQFFMCKGLMDSGINAYTHELTHIYDETVWFNGYGLRSGVSGEAYATGLFESENNTQTRDGGASSYAPIFNLNTAYSLGDNRIQNQSPERFAKTEDLGEYMQGVMDVIYTLDVIEAQEILKLSDEDKAILFNKVSLVDDSSVAGRKLDCFENITEDEAAKLTTIDDLVDNNIVSGRLIPKGSSTTQTISYNEYAVVPMFEGVYAGLQNDEGNVGEFLFRRYAYELLGEYGWENGMVAYVSSQYANDGEALEAILDDKYSGDLAAFKKDMFQRRADKLKELKPTDKYEDAEAMREAISKALQTDLTSMKNGKAGGTSYYMLYVKEVQNVKADIFKEYLLMTEDFEKSIYQGDDEESGDSSDGSTDSDSDSSEEVLTPEPTDPSPEPETPAQCSHSYTKNAVKNEALKSAATCTSAAVYYKSCSTCDEVGTSGSNTFTYGSALGHKYGAYVTTKKAGFGIDGKQLSTCSGCKATKSKTIAKVKDPVLSAAVYTFNNKTKTPIVTVKDSAGMKVKFSATYASSRRNVGKYAVKVKLAGANYSGTKTVYFKINPKGVIISKLSKAKKSFTVKWKKPSSKYRKEMTGYQIRYSTSKKMTNAKTVTVKSTKATSKKIKKLKAKKKYYVQIRTYKTVKGVKYYSGWSSTKSVKTR